MYLVVIKYEVMYKYSLDDNPWEFAKRFNTYEEAEAWIRMDSPNWEISYTIFKVYKGK
jgi:hypothetical protein